MLAVAVLVGRPGVAMDDELMTLEDIATMWRCSVKHARDVVVKTHGFPDTAPGSSPRNRVWLRKEIRDFAHRRPARIPQQPSQPA